MTPDQFFELPLSGLVQALEAANLRVTEALWDMPVAETGSTRLPIRRDKWRIISVPNNRWVLQERCARPQGEHRTHSGWKPRSRPLGYAEALHRLMTETPQWEN